MELLFPSRKNRGLQDITEVTPAHILPAAVAWTARYSSLVLWEKALKFVATTYWTHGPCSLPSYSPAVTVPLPELDTEAFLLAPLLQDMDADSHLGPASYSENGPRMMTESTLTALVLAYAHHPICDVQLDWLFRVRLPPDPVDQEAALALRRAGSESDAGQHGVGVDASGS